MSYRTTVIEYLNKDSDAIRLFSAFVQNSISPEIYESNYDSYHYKIFTLFVNVHESIKRHGITNIVDNFRKSSKENRQAFDSYYGSVNYNLDVDTIRDKTVEKIYSIFGLISLKINKLDHMIDNKLYKCNEYQHKKNKAEFISYFNNYPDLKDSFNSIIGEDYYVEQILSGQRNFNRDMYQIFKNEFIKEYDQTEINQLLNSYFATGNTKKKMQLFGLLAIHNKMNMNVIDRVNKYIIEIECCSVNFNVEEQNSIKNVINLCRKIYE